jgi:hypothetical protein
MLRLIALLLGRDTTPRLPTFRYKYLRHPFDDMQFFSVEAADQAAADTLAVAKYTAMFSNRQTVLREFWAA